MLKITRPQVPPEIMYEINRLNVEKTDMTVLDNVQKGGCFILHDVAYKALQALPKGTWAEPGKNCVKINLNEMIGGN